jgi:hypothetical protein
MIVVSYNLRDVAGDEFAAIASKGRNAIGVTSVSDLASKLGSYDDHSITTLIIADHGAEGVQGVGSGEQADYSAGKNLSSEHITTIGVQPGSDGILAAKGTSAGPMLAYLMSLAKSNGVTRAQGSHLDVIARKIKIGGNLLLAGCAVGSGSDGPDLLKSLGLYLQNSIRVVASLHKTCWTDAKAKTISPARHPSARKLTAADVIGFIGSRSLSAAELTDVLDNSDFMSTGR